MMNKARVAVFVLGTLLLTLACQVSNINPGGAETEPSSVLPGAPALACPTGPTQMELVVSHSFNWSQNRDLENFYVEGSTEAGTACPVTISGDQVTSEPCQVGYSNSGFYTTTDAGKCDLTGFGAAMVEISGTCQDGRVVLQISEAVDESALTGLLTCPDLLGTAYVTYYPATKGTYTFFLEEGGYLVKSEVVVDPSNRFSYTKTWTLIPPAGYQP